MTLANGSLILSGDVNGLTSSALNLLQVDASQLPGGRLLHLDFSGLKDDTTVSEWRRRKRVVVPWDCYLDAVAVYVNGATAASTLTVTVAADGVGPAFPVVSTGALAAANTDLARVYFDGTLSSPTALLMPVNRALRFFTRGQTLTVKASTTSVATNTRLAVVLVLRSFFGRA